MEDLLGWLASCRVCPHMCRADRLRGQKGKCRTGTDIVVSSAHLHFGEEPVLVGAGGSGTIFFTACNLTCVFCQNYEISQLDSGKPITREEFIDILFLLARKGAENINLVSPTHQGPQIFDALRDARRRGLGLPIVYNCGGYENPEFIATLDGLIDIYMPDFKYGRDTEADSLSGARRYTEYCTESLLEMHRQVGDLVVDHRNVATRGLLIRHLVLPDHAACSKEVIDFIAERLSLDTVVNIMDQYRPSYHAHEYERIARRTHQSEVYETIEYAKDRGLRRIIS
jgi:putative pyruvate formate lyase activating enzyme